jgi:hypothetical protein
MNKALSRAGAGLCAAALVALAVSCTRSKPAEISPMLTAKKRDDPTIALNRKLAAMQTFAPMAAARVTDSPDRASNQDWLEHATPGTDIPLEAFERSRRDWGLFAGRAGRAAASWTPLGPTYGKGPFNVYRNRSVYNAGTDNFSGRTIDGVISPACVEGDCTLWIANANGGVWRTKNALAPVDANGDGPVWEYISETFQHNSVAALALDPNDATHQTIWAGTGEPNACGSGCEAGVGVYQSTDGGDTWRGPLGKAQFNARAVGSIAVKPGNSRVIFAASGRGVRGVSNTCCGGVDAIIPGAPHFGLYRSTNNGRTWQLVHQGAIALCTLNTPDEVALNQTPCAARGARRVRIDPTDPNTVYVSFFSRGIWRSRQNGDPGTWEPIMAPVGPGGTSERAEFDVVALPSGETRMYVGVGGGVIPPNTAAFSRFRRNDAVRNVAATTVLTTWQDLTSSTPNTPGYSSFGFCDPQCSYDNYVYVPKGADADTVYLLGDNEYNENNFVSGRSNGRAVLLSTNAGVHFTDMTEDDRDDMYPGALHPDHHALVTNPNNWRQFFDLGDGGVARSNGVFVDDSDDCAAPPKSITNPDRLAFCRLVLARVPERIDAINKGLRTLHFYQIEYSKHDPDRIVGGTQDNGSWETLGDPDTWINVNIADGGHNSFDALGGDPNFRLTGFQQGQLSVSYTPQDQVDTIWISDTLFVFYGGEAVPFIGNAITDPVTPGWIWTGREHVFRSTNYGRNQAIDLARQRLHCNIWTGDGDIDEDGTYEPETDLCDDFQPLGDPGVAGRLTNVSYGADRTGGHVALVERGKGTDTQTLWAATSNGRVFISKNAADPSAAAVTFTRVDNLSPITPPRYPTAMFVDPADPNHAWITYSGFNAKTPATPGHVFEIRYRPATPVTPASVDFTNLDGRGFFAYGDIPANSIVVSPRGTILVGNDFGVVQRNRFLDGWTRAGDGLPRVVVSDLVLVPERSVVYAGTHGQGIWQMGVR